MTGHNNSSLSRRTLATGVAWSVPAAVLASAAPAFAASGNPPKLDYQGACKYPGSSCTGVPKGYGVVMKVTNLDLVKTVYLCDPIMTTAATDNGGNPLAFTYQGIACIEILPGQTVDVVFKFSGSGDSQNQSFSFDFSVAWGHECPCANDDDNHPRIVLPGLLVEDTPPHTGICSCK